MLKIVILSSPWGKANASLLTWSACAKTRVTLFVHVPQVHLFMSRYMVEATKAYVAAGGVILLKQGVLLGDPVGHIVAVVMLPISGFRLR